MTILVTGVTGQLGYDVVEDLKSQKLDYLAPTHIELDITNESQVQDYFHRHNIDYVMHCAAWTKVDQAEKDVELCRLVNVQGTSNIVKECAEKNIPMLYVSTDYVFNGTGNRPWKTDDPVSPINVYGQSKLDGELEVKKLQKYYIVRISWVFGINGNNFVKTMIKLSQTKKEISIVDDQFGSPTYTKDLAPLMREILLSEKYGTYHAHNEGVCSWYEFAKNIFEIIHSNIVVHPVHSCQYPTIATRPKNSRLDTELLKKNGFKKLPVWTNATVRYIEELSKRFNKDL